MFKDILRDMSHATENPPRRTGYNGLVKLVTVIVCCIST